MKTLVIQYLPSGERSHTKRLLDRFLNNVKGIIETVDLLKEQIPVFDKNSLNVYMKKAYWNEPINKNEELLLEPFMKLINQLKTAHVIIVACPMYNFSVPGIVKCYFDAVVIKNETFSETPVGEVREYKGLLNNPKALILFTAGGNLTPDHPAYKFNQLDKLMKLNFSFMGADEIEIVTAGTSNPKTIESNFINAFSKLDAIAKKWYK